MMYLPRLWKFTQQVNSLVFVWDLTAHSTYTVQITSYETITIVLVFWVYNRPLSQYSCSTKVWSTTNINHTNEKNKTKLVSGPRGIHQSIAKRRHFGNFNFYKVLYGKPCPFSLYAVQNLIKTTIFKLMALRHILVYDSDNRSTY